MVTGFNKVYEHAGRNFHIQAEDVGETAACIEVRVYDGGTVLWQKRISYQDLAGQNLPRAEMDAGVRALMEKTAITVQAAISKGKIA